MMRRRTALIVVIIGAAAMLRAPMAFAQDNAAWDVCPHPRPGADADRHRDSLPAIEQAMLDAIAPGDSALWSRYLAPDGWYTDENDESRTARQLVAEIRPLPKGFSGGLCVSKMHVTGTGDVAVLSFDELEHETVFGQTLRTRYHATDTWVWRNGRWRLLAGHTAVLPSEHTAVPIDAAALAAYVGTYAVDSTLTYTVTADGGRLYGRQGSHPAQALFPLGGDRFFVRGAPRGVKIFHRDAAGAVDAMIDRRDNNDLVWRRVGAAVR